MLFFAKLHYQIQGHHDSIVRKIFYVIPSTVRWRVAVAAGLNVIVSNSRGPETLTGIVAELGDQARAATVEEAAQASDIVVVSIPFRIRPKNNNENNDKITYGI